MDGRARPHRAPDTRPSTALTAPDACAPSAFSFILIFDPDRVIPMPSRDLRRACAATVRALDRGADGFRNDSAESRVPHVGAATIPRNHGSPRRGGDDSAE